MRYMELYAVGNHETLLVEVIIMLIVKIQIIYGMFMTTMMLKKKVEKSFQDQHILLILRQKVKFL